MFHVKLPTPPALAFLVEAIGEARERDLWRDRLCPSDGRVVSFCSNDYLALADRVGPPERCGAGASRLVSGEREVHRRLEGAAAALVEMPAALAFTSGYAANVGLLSALAGPGDLIVSDALNHASIIDGARLSRAQVVVTAHLQLDAVEEALRNRRGGRAFVVTESYFSMDADSPDLPALRRLCDLYGAALIVDEAHALGVLGPDGRGLCAESTVRPDALVGTFGKAFGAAGAFVAGCDALTSWLWNRARSFVFSTGLSPMVAAAALQGVSKAQAEPERRHNTLTAAGLLREGLSSVGARPRGFGHVVPCVVGQAKDALALAEALRGEGIDVRAIRPPSVPPGTARLRFTVTAAHGEADITRAVDAVDKALGRGDAWRAG